MSLFTTAGPAAEPDLIVIGGGPAAAAAASEAAAQGLAVVLLDETDQAVWSVSGAFRVDTIGAGGPRHYAAPAVVVASGMQERVIPFPGWTTPGVLGLADTAIGLKTQRVLPGQRWLVAGCGKLLAEVGAAILALGGEVAAIVDLAARGDRASRLPVLHRMTVREVVSGESGLEVTVGEVDGEGRALHLGQTRHFTVDAVAVGHGLMPATDITRLMRVAHAYDSIGGFWYPVLDRQGRSSLPGLYVAGDADSGRIAGLAVARDLGRISADGQAHRATKRRRRDAMMAPGPGLVEAIGADVVVCRCEEVTRGEIDAAVRGGAANLNQLKAWTRCGMGPCQGRMCADIAAALMAAHGIAPQDAGQFTGRTPLRPVPLDLLTGDYAYADIVLPPAAPP